MTLEFIRDWRGNYAGQIREVDNGVGEAYIARGVAKLVDKVKQLDPQLVAVEPVKRRRGRPRIR